MFWNNDDDGVLKYMGMKFEGKKMLMLGSNAGSADMVRYARDCGAYTVTADYYPQERSEAKLAANESVLISTADTEKLAKLIEDKKIDGVLAGISEFNLMKAMELSEMFGLRFYCSREQWELIEHKDKFRTLCENYNVPCPKTYFIGNDVKNVDKAMLPFPVVIKPVDCSASLGVHICESQNSFAACFDDALGNSEGGQVIIEEFVNGDEFTAHYTVCNGKATFSCIDNRYPVAVHDGRVTTIPAARIYPSTYIDGYMERVNPYMLKLCERLGLQNGVLFIQGIHNTRTGQFWIFEGGLRSAAETPNRLLNKTNGVNYMNLLVDHALLGVGNLDSSREDPYMHGKCCGIVSFVAKHGIVGTIGGLEEAVAATPSVISYESRYPVGSETPDTDTLRQLMVRFVMVCDSREQMARDVRYLNNHITILDEQGENMVIKLEPDRILSEFSIGGGYWRHLILFYLRVDNPSWCRRNNVSFAIGERLVAA